MDIVRVSDYLNPDEVLDGYRKGIFPMGYPDSPVITWHLPERRGILPLQHVHVSRSLQRTLRQGRFEIRFDTAFAAVMDACAERGLSDDPDATWITPRIKEVYSELHRNGHAHSVEVWRAGQLVGGTYGVHLGAAFFAESKFHRERDMSKVALVHLAQHLRDRGFRLLDVQYWTPHLDQFGVVEVDRNEYYWRLREALQSRCVF